MGSPAPTPLPHTPVIFLLGGGSGTFSAECQKLLMEAGYDPAAFGKLDKVDQATKRAQERVAAYKALKSENDPNAENIRPSNAEFLMAEHEAQKLADDPANCAAQMPAGPARSPATASGTEASDAHRAGANGGEAAAPMQDAAAAREQDKPQLARQEGQPESSKAALAPEARAHANVDESMGDAARAGGNQASGGSRSKGKSTATIEGKTAGECIDNFVKQAMADLNYQFKEAKPAADRGMLDEHDAAFAALAKKNNEIILVRNSNPIAAQLMQAQPNEDQRKAGINRFASKPEAVKAKTRKTDPNIGLAAVDPNNAAEVAEHEKYGYKILGPEQGNIVVDPKTNAAFYSDYDLHGAYSAESGQSVMPQHSSQANEKINSYNAELGDTMINHGPHDEWEHRNNKDIAKNNYGPRGDCTAYTPSGDKFQLDNAADMKAFYTKNCLNWPYDE